MPSDPLTLALLRFGILAVVAAAFALLLRCAGLPGGRPAAAIAGGIVAGLLLGPGVLGQIAPEPHEQVFRGAVEERRSLEEAQQEQSAAIAAAREAELGEEEVAQILREHREALLPLQRDLDQARHEHREPVGMIVAITLAGALFLAGWGRRRPRAGIREGDAGTPFDEVAPSIAAGLAALLFAALPTALLLIWLAQAPRDVALAAGAAVASGTAFAGLIVRRIAPEGRSRSGQLAMLSLLIGAAALLWIVSDGETRLVLTVPAVAMAFGLVLSTRLPAPASTRRIARGAALWLVVPTLAALAASSVEPMVLVSDWRPVLFLLLTILLAADGHFIGAWLAWLTFGTDAQRRAAARTYLESHADGVGMTQVCFAAVLVCGGLIDPHTLLGAMVVGGVLLNALVPDLLLTINRSAIEWLEAELTSADPIDDAEQDDSHNRTP